MSRVEAGAAASRARQPGREHAPARRPRPAPRPPRPWPARRTAWRRAARAGPARRRRPRPPRRTPGRPSAAERRRRSRRRAARSTGVPGQTTSSASATRSGVGGDHRIEPGQVGQQVGDVLGERAGEGGRRYPRRAGAGGWRAGEQQRRRPGGSPGAVPGAAPGVDLGVRRVARAASPDAPRPRRPPGSPGPARPAGSAGPAPRSPRRGRAPAGGPARARARSRAPSRASRAAARTPGWCRRRACRNPSAPPCWTPTARSPAPGRPSSTVTASCRARREQRVVAAPRAADPALVARLQPGQHLGHPAPLLRLAEARRDQHHRPVAVPVGRHGATAPRAPPHLDGGRGSRRRSAGEPRLHGSGPGRQIRCVSFFAPQPVDTVSRRSATRASGPHGACPQPVPRRSTRTPRFVPRLSTGFSTGWSGPALTGRPAGPSVVPDGAPGLRSDRPLGEGERSVQRDRGLRAAPVHLRCSPFSRRSPSRRGGAARRRGGGRSAAGEAGRTPFPLRPYALPRVLGRHGDRLGDRLPGQRRLEARVPAPGQRHLGQPGRDRRPGGDRPGDRRARRPGTTRPGRCRSPGPGRPPRSRSPPGR